MDVVITPIKSMNQDIFTNGFKILGNFIEACYNQYMNVLDMWLVFLGKNRDVFHYNRDTSIDTLNAYMKGYEKAKEEYTTAIKNTTASNASSLSLIGSSSNNNRNQEKDPAACYF